MSLLGFLLLLIFVCVIQCDRLAKTKMNMKIHRNSQNQISLLKTSPIPINKEIKVYVFICDFEEGVTLNFCYIYLAPVDFLNSVIKKDDLCICWEIWSQSSNILHTYDSLPVPAQ